MRLEMRIPAGLAVAVPLLVVSVSCCWLCTPHAPIGDVVSGAPKGSALVKVLVTLTGSGTCEAAVNPPRVIVYRGSAIRWRIVNNCAPGVGYLQFTRPTPRPSKDGHTEPTPWDYRFCTGRITTLYKENDERNVLLCEVPETVALGLYKYGLEGAARVDPEIEVRGGGR